MGSNIRRADDEVTLLLRDLINEHHAHLRNANILCLFTSKPRKRGGKVTIATCEAVNETYNFLTEINFIITIFDKAWERLADKEKKYVLDHELCHAFIGENKQGEPVYKVIPHDLEEFNELVERYGLIQRDLAPLLEDL